MQKGVSPVVATVVLIMMAVLAAAAVWYWTASYTTKPPTPDTTQKGYVVVDVYRNASSTGCNAVDVKNTGGLPLNNIVFEVRDYATGKVAGANGTDANATNQALVNISFEIAAGLTMMENISFPGNVTNRTSVQFGTYLLRVSTRTPSTTQITGFTDQLFTCA